jgi:hypothetical protein
MSANNDNLALFFLSTAFSINDDKMPLQEWVFTYATSSASVENNRKKALRSL